MFFTKIVSFNKDDILNRLRIYRIHTRLNIWTGKVILNRNQYKSMLATIDTKFLNEKIIRIFSFCPFSTVNMRPHVGGGFIKKIARNERIGLLKTNNLRFQMSFLSSNKKLKITGGKKNQKRGGRVDLYRQIIILTECIPEGLLLGGRALNRFTENILTISGYTGSVSTPWLLFTYSTISCSAARFT